MATGRTVGASLLTEKDAKVIGLAGRISETLAEAIDDLKARKAFARDYRRVSHTREQVQVGVAQSCREMRFYGRRKHDLRRPIGCGLRSLRFGICPYSGDVVCCGQLS